MKENNLAKQTQNNKNQVKKKERNNTLATQTHATTNNKRQVKTNERNNTLAKQTNTTQHKISKHK